MWRSTNTEHPLQLFGFVVTCSIICSVVFQNSLILRRRLFSKTVLCTGISHTRTVLPFLVRNPPLQLPHKRRDHVKLASISTRPVAIALLVLLETRQILERIPLNLANLLPRLGLEIGILGHASEGEEAHVLLTHSDVEMLDLVLVLGDQARLRDVVARLLPDLADGAVEILLVLVDLAAGKGPRGALLPASHE